MNLDQVLKELKEKYLQELPTALERMYQALEVFNENAFKEECHKLKGTGKTYGIEEISTVSAELEKVSFSEENTEVLLLGVQLLEKIHNSQCQGEKFDLKNSAEFVRIQRQAKRKTSS